MPGGSIGTVFVELDLDPTRYTRAQQRLYKDATTTTLNIEANFKKLGIRSSAEMDLMRAKITNAYNMIAHSSKATANDILRAEKAKNDQLKALNEEQFGHQTNLLSQLKQHWLGTAAAVYAAWRSVRMVINAISGDVRLAMEQEKAERGLRQAMISMKRYSDETYQSLLKQASAMQRLTGIGDELTISGQKMLMTFKQIPDELMGRTTRAMLDLAALMGGNVNQAALQLGKAAMGLTGELRRVGITIDQETYRLEGFSGVLRQIEEQVGGQAEAVAQGSGKWKILGASIGDAKEAAGALFTKFAEGSGIIDGLTLAVNALTKSLDTLGDLDKNIGLTPSQRAFDIVSRNVANLQGNRAVQQLLFETYMPAEVKAMLMLQQEATSAITKNILSPDYQKAKSEILDLIDKFTMSGYDIKVKALNERFAEYKRILGDTKEVQKAFELSLQALNKEFGKTPAIAKPGIPLPSGKLSEFQAGFGLSQFVPSLIIGEVEKSSKEAITKIESHWDDFSEYAGNSFINAMVSGSDDWLKYLSREFQRTFLQETMGTQIKGLMSGIFGEKGFLQKTTFASLGGASLGDILGAGALGYGMGGIGGGIGSIGGFMAGSKLLTSGVFAEGGALAGAGGPIGMIIGGVLGGAITSFFEHDESLADSIKRQYDEAFDSMMIDLRTTISEAVGGGFMDAFKSQDYNAFMNSIDTMIYDLVGGVFTKLASSQVTEPLAEMFEPVYKQIANMEFFASDAFSKAVREEAVYMRNLYHKGAGWPKELFEVYYGDSIKDYLKSHPGTDFTELLIPVAQQKLMAQYGGGGTMADVIGAFPAGSAIEDWGQEFKPLIEELMDIYGSVLEALGLNTDALTENTSAILGPVNAYLNQLAGMDTGPTSLAWLENRRNELWQQAMMNPDQFQPYSSFMTGGYISQQQGMGGFNIGAERQNVENIPWVKEAKQPIVVNVIVDGEVIKQEVKDSFDDPNVVKKVKSLWESVKSNAWHI